MFRRDLRLGDHAALAQAARFGEVVPSLVVEPGIERDFDRHPRRAAYHCGAIASLHADLAAHGTALVVRRGPRLQTILRLAREAEVAVVCWSAAYDAATIAADRDLAAALEEAGFRVAIAHDAPAIAPDDTAAARRDEDGNGYRSLTPYLAAWRAQSRARYGETRVPFAVHALPSEPLPAYRLASSTADNDLAAPSERATLAAFEAFLGGAALAYRTSRNVPAGAHTARVSAALSFGVVSVRSLLARVDERRSDPFLLAEERASLDALVRAFAQRDFFLQLAWFFEGAPDAALQSRMADFPLAASHPALERWRAGRTGYPLVDAGMRELAATGWMHPRVRLVAASFLCFDLGVDWRVGRDMWDALLVEDEPALAGGNWQWVAGVGADLAQVPRIFNPRKQARWFDPRGAYVRHWVPELADVPDAAVLDPAAAASRAQLALPLFDGGAYPAPVVDHESAARAYLARYAAFIRRAAAG